MGIIKTTTPPEIQNISKQDGQSNEHTAIGTTNQEKGTKANPEKKVDFSRAKTARHSGVTGEHPDKANPRKPTASDVQLKTLTRSASALSVGGSTQSSARSDFGYLDVSDVVSWLIASLSSINQTLSELEADSTTSSPITLTNQELLSSFEENILQSSGNENLGTVLPALRGIVSETVENPEYSLLDYLCCTSDRMNSSALRAKDVARLCDTINKKQVEIKQRVYETCHEVRSSEQPLGRAHVRLDTTPARIVDIPKDALRLIGNALDSVDTSSGSMDKGAWQSTLLARINTHGEKQSQPVSASALNFADHFARHLENNQRGQLGSFDFVKKHLPQLVMDYGRHYNWREGGEAYPDPLTPEQLFHQRQTTSIERKANRKVSDFYRVDARLKHYDITPPAGSQLKSVRGDTSSGVGDATDLSGGTLERMPSFEPMVVVNEVVRIEMKKFVDDVANKGIDIGKVFDKERQLRDTITEAYVQERYPKLFTQHDVEATAAKSQAIA